ncbi:Uncharacterized protein SCG7086_BJ_00080 [Chlamydiales bacterium SCGC AG-110-P3]|nr:Uncharacterized protein SCG7086_BJ_00080 [Chlamydiales bacterium SCGC AG-110-P3]
MTNALIGYTGFVGTNLLFQTQFEDLFRSTNIREIRGKSYHTLVCSGAPAAKWIANKNPEDDSRNIAHLICSLQEVSAEHVVLISTVDVYSNPTAVDESSPIDIANAEPYGKHRYELEQFVCGHFDSVLIVRLPGLFGIGLRKNAIYDLIHDNALDLIHSEARYQFYDLANLWKDIQRAQREGLSLLNITTEPVSIGELAQECFSRSFYNRPHDNPASYDIRSCHDMQLGGKGGYLYTKEEVLSSLKSFVAQQLRESV